MNKSFSIQRPNLFNHRLSAMTASPLQKERPLGVPVGVSEQKMRVGLNRFTFDLHNTKRRSEKGNQKIKAEERFGLGTGLDLFSALGEVSGLLFGFYVN